MLKREFIIGNTLKGVLTSEQQRRAIGLDIGTALDEQAKPIKRVFRLLLLFDRQYILSDLLCSAEDKLHLSFRALIAKRNGQNSTLFNLVAAVLHKLQKVNSGDGAYEKKWFGLSGKMRYTLQECLIVLA